MRFQRLVLAVFLSACAPDLEGDWSGEAAGRAVSFHVNEDGELDEFLVKLSLSFGPAGGACIAPFELRDPVPVQDGNFQTSLHFAGWDVAPALRGSFDSDGEASGTIDAVVDDQLQISCGSTRTTVTSSRSWTILAQTTWSATKDENEEDAGF
jgi:hypothetical protein